MLGHNKQLAQKYLMRLLKVRLVSDAYERLCELGLRPPLDGKRRGWLSAIEGAGLLFVHVPKCAGMSISRALYGQHITHCSMRYYSRVSPKLVLAVPSFAVVRDPIERFLSSYSYARNGGSSDNRVSPAFRDTYMAFRSVDDAIDHVESARSPYEIDHIFRSQSWFITDSEGRLSVDTLVPFDDLSHIADWIPGFPTHRLKHLNCGTHAKAHLTRQQTERLHALYKSDLELVATAMAGPYQDLA